MKKYVLTILIIAMAILFNVAALAEEELYSETATENDSVVFCEENIENLTMEDKSSEELVEPEEPSASDESIPSEEPAVSEEPSASDEPIPSEEPAASEEPSASDEPIPSEEPAASEEPSASDEPIPSDEPAASEEPSASDEPENPDAIDGDSDAKQNDGDVESVEIIEIITPSSIYLQFFPIGQLIENIKLPEYAYAQTGPHSFLECNIDWDSTNVIDTSFAGRQMLRGTLIAPEGISFSGGLEPVIEIPVLVYDENGEGTETLVPPDVTAPTILAALNTSPSEYINPNNQYTLYTQYGDCFYAKAVWEEAVSFNECGEYTVSGRLALPYGIKAENENDLLLEQKFFVMNDDKIYLDFVTIENGDIICSWLKFIDDSDNIEVYYSEDKKEWQIDDLYGFAIDNAFIIPTTALMPDTDYYFRLKYDNEFTNILHVNITADKISANIVEGDRDGGDAAHQEMPAYIEEAKPLSSAFSRPSSGGSRDTSVIAYGISVPAASPKISPQFLEDTYTEAVIPSEMVNDTVTEISGARIEDMLEANPDNIVFEKDGISVELTPDFVDRNNIEPNDIVNVAIDRKEDSFTIDISSKGNVIEEIPGTVVKFHVNSETAPTVISDEGTQHETVLTDNIASLEIDKTGTYTSDALSDDVNTDNNKDRFPIVYCITGAIVIAAAAALLWRKLRHGK